MSSPAAKTKKVGKKSATSKEVEIEATVSRLQVKHFGGDHAPEHYEADAQQYIERKEWEWACVL